VSIRFGEDSFIEFDMTEASNSDEIENRKVRMVFKQKTYKSGNHWVRLYVENGNNIEWKADITRDALYECLQWMEDADEDAAIVKKQKEEAKERLMANGHH